MSEHEERGVDRETEDRPACADAAADREHEADIKARQEALLDEGVEETFPASDPVAVVRL